MFDRLPLSIDQPAYTASPPTQRLPRNAAVVRPYVDARRRAYIEPHGPLAPPPMTFLPPPSAAIPPPVPQKYGGVDWMTWSPRRSNVYSSSSPAPGQSHISSTPKCSPRHVDTASVRSRSSTGNIHDPSTKRVLLTPDPRRTLTTSFSLPTIIIRGKIAQKVTLN